MSLWLVRAGKYGEHETRFIEDGRIYLTWEELTQSDMQGIADYDGIKQLVAQKYPGEPIRRIGNWSGQIWAFVLAMKPGACWSSRSASWPEGGNKPAAQADPDTAVLTAPEYGSGPPDGLSLLATVSSSPSLQRLR